MHFQRFDFKVYAIIKTLKLDLIYLSLTTVSSYSCCGNFCFPTFKDKVLFNTEHEVALH